MSEVDNLIKLAVLCRTGGFGYGLDANTIIALSDEVIILRNQLEDLKQRDAAIVEVITAMYDQVHEERDALQAKLDVAVEAMKLARYDVRINTHASLMRPILEEALKRL